MGEVPLHAPEAVCLLSGLVEERRVEMRDGEGGEAV